MEEKAALADSCEPRSGFVNARFVRAFYAEFTRREAVGVERFVMSLDRF